MKAEAAALEAEIGRRCGPQPAMRRSSPAPFSGARADEHCFEAGSSFASESCNCFGTTPHTQLASRPVVRILSSSRLAAATTAWLLKIVVEEVLGYQTQLVAAFRTAADAWLGLQSGTVHMNPEVCLVQPGASTMDAVRSAPLCTSRWRVMTIYTRPTFVLVMLGYHCPRPAHARGHAFASTGGVSSRLTLHADYGCRWVC